jgi:hypothetical protein
MPTPVLIGIADIKNRSLRVEDAVEPLELMLQAIYSSLKDTGLSASQTKTLQISIDSISVVNTWTWKYHDLPNLIGEKLGVNGGKGNKKGYRELSHHGGDSPVRMVDEAARRIAKGTARVGVVVGGEGLGSCEFSNISFWRGEM